MSGRAALFVGLVMACAWRTHAQVGVWRSELTLWGHAAAQAPLKPRPALNYGSALLMAGEPDGAVRWWVRARDLTQQGHIPTWDAARTQRSVEANLERVRAVR